MDNLTLDYLPNHPNIKIYQHKKMFRINTDTAILGEFIYINPNDTVLDIGTNNGALLLYSNLQNPKHLTGIDINSDALEIANKNLTLNNITNYTLIHKDANEEYCIHNLKNCKMLKFNRLIEFSDICQVKIIFDAQEYCYWLNWDNEASNCYNSYQSCYLTDEGHLYISVAKDKTIYDFLPQNCLFDNEVINDSFSLCDIEDNKTE